MYGIIKAKFQDAATIEELIKDIPASRRNIVRQFKQIIRIITIEHLQQNRVEAAKIIKKVGMTPIQYREKFKVR